MSRIAQTQQSRFPKVCYVCSLLASLPCSKLSDNTTCTPSGNLQEYAPNCLPCYHWCTDLHRMFAVPTPGFLQVDRWDVPVTARLHEHEAATARTNLDLYFMQPINRGAQQAWRRASGPEHDNEEDLLVCRLCGRLRAERSVHQILARRPLLYTKKGLRTTRKISKQTPTWVSMISDTYRRIKGRSMRNHQTQLRLMLYFITSRQSCLT